MIAGLSGTLLSHDAIERLVGEKDLPHIAAEGRHTAVSRLRAWYAAIHSDLGPSCSLRVLFDLVAEPLVRALGFHVIPISHTANTMAALLTTDGVAAAVMLVAPWGESAGAMWRQAVHRGLAHEVRWAFGVSGSTLRLFDVHRAYARRYAEFDLETTIQDDEALAVFCRLLQARAVSQAAEGSALELAVRFCEEYRAEVRLSLRHGVHDALLRLITAFRIVSRGHADGQVLDESLTVVYRILFLLFAEARGLVPVWHPVYRDGYTIESLRQQIERQPPTGVWEALQAVARLAHRGCRAGTLRVPPFNGRLFSPAIAPLADSLPLDDRGVGQAIVALTTRERKGGAERISYADLGVEQLGSVYEHLLDYDLAAAVRGAPAVLVATGRRKATGSFYTPRSLTEFLVRRTLAPLVHEATPEQILALRVLDPAMGSGAFLVVACRYLATAYEHALIREGTLSPSDLDDEDRAAFRRVVAQRCLFGVDVNPMAVQLGRLSLWLATLAADRPLTFLDHHLRPGNSLVGAGVDDIIRQPAPGGRAKRVRDLPLFGFDALRASLESAVGSRLTIAQTPDDTLEQVRGKEKVLAQLTRPGSPMDGWKMAADLWCAAWYEGTNRATDRGMFRALVDRVMRGTGPLPGHLSDPLLRAARDTAATHGFFHWTFEFPEVFYDDHGAPLGRPGFDAVVGNPPWEMLRDEGAAVRTRELHAFVRGSGVYAMQGPGHANLYQVFFERMVQLLRSGGRCGLVMPASFATDHGGGMLRRYLFDRTTIDTYTILENRDGIFPIHRGLKFLLTTFTADGSTPELPARTGVRSSDALDMVADRGVDASAIRISRALIERVSGETLAVPDVRGPADLDILSMVALRAPALGERDGWGVRFGRELNASDDRPHFREDGVGLPVLEGKHIHPFAVHAGSARFSISESVAGRLLNANGTFKRARLAYRDVASSTNRTTLIAAVLPANVVTTHTVFCVKEPLDDDSQQFLCGIFNSYVANYLVRMWVGMHVTSAIISRLRVPKPPRDGPSFQRIAGLSRSLADAPGASKLARLNAAVARLYGLSTPQFAHVLDTFPLVPAVERAATLRLL